MSKMYKEKEEKITNRNKWLFKEFLIIMVCYIPIILTLIFILFIRIRQKKLIVMNFFLNIPSKSLEKIIVNCNEFVVGLNSYDKHVENVEKADEEEIALRTMEYETGSLVSISQQQFHKKKIVNHKKEAANSESTGNREKDNDKDAGGLRANINNSSNIRPFKKVII